MPRVSPIVTSFNAGEWAPYMYGRVDLQKYANACRSLRNFVPLAQGAATRRPGFRFAAASKSNRDGILIPFKFSTVQAYAIEATDLCFRFYKDKGLIESTPGTPLEVAVPYTLADLADLQWTQSTDTLYLVHPKYAPRKLTRSSHTSWTLTTIAFTGGPSEWTGTNWPGAVAFFQDRLFFAGTPAQPQTVWSSKSGDFENLTTGTAADAGLKFTINDGEVNKIEWLSASRKALLVGTAGGEFSISASTLGEALTPDNITANPETNEGCARQLPLRIGQATLFVQRAQKQLFEMVYNFEQDAQTSPELSLLARHIVRGRVRRIAWQRQPWSVVWACLEDGSLVGCTYMRDQQVVGWHRHPIGGTAVKVRSIATIPGLGQDELWALIERTIGGATVRYVEVLENAYEPADENDKANAFFVDSGISYSGSATTSIGGAAHLAGETVQVLADGAVHDDVVVDGSGNIALTRAASTVQLGLKYISRLETLPLEAGSANGTAQTKTTRVVRVGVRFVETLGALVGYDETVAGGMERIEFRDPTMPMDQSPPLFTGSKRVDFPGTWDDEAIVRVVQDQPLPCTIAAMVPLIQTNDG